MPGETARRTGRAPRPETLPPSPGTTPRPGILPPRPGTPPPRPGTPPPRPGIPPPRPGTTPKPGILPPGPATPPPRPGTPPPGLGILSPRPGTTPQPGTPPTARKQPRLGIRPMAGTPPGPGPPPTGRTTLTPGRYLRHCQWPPRPRPSTGFAVRPRRPGTRGPAGSDRGRDVVGRGTRGQPFPGPEPALRRVRQAGAGAPRRGGDRGARARPGRAGSGRATARARLVRGAHAQRVHGRGPRRVANGPRPHHRDARRRPPSRPGGAAPGAAGGGGTPAAVRGRRLRGLLLLARPRQHRGPDLPPWLAPAAAQLAAPAGRVPRAGRVGRGLRHPGDAAPRPAAAR